VRFRVTVHRSFELESGEKRKNGGTAGDREANACRHRRGEGWEHHPIIRIAAHLADNAAS
jgi:hypothetical protein